MIIAKRPRRYDRLPAIGLTMPPRKERDGCKPRTTGREIAEAKLLEEMLRAARSRRLPLPEIVLWSTASQHPSESQTSECSDLLSRSRATCLIVAQRQPGKLNNHPHPTQLSPGKSNATGANRRPPQKTTSAFGWLEEMLAARSRAKIEKVTLDDPKLTAIFSKRRKIGAS